VAAARQFFKLPEESPRLRIEIGDGHEFVAATSRRFDLILVDGFDEKGRTGMLDTLPFYVNCRARLSAKGLMAVNLVDRSRGVGASLQRIREAFDDRVLLMPPFEEANTVAIAATGERIDLSAESLLGAARELKTGTGLDLVATMERYLASANHSADSL
jgi:spermidine synthase